jgi:hypothetical protein
MILERNIKDLFHGAHVIDHLPHFLFAEAADITF